MIDRDFAPVSDTFRNSLAYRLAHAAIERSAAAAAESTAMNRMRGLQRSFTTFTIERKIETIAMTLAIAALAHLAIRELLPRYATSGLPWWWNVAAAVSAAIVALLAKPIASAWTESLPAKLLRP